MSKHSTERNKLMLFIVKVALSCLAFSFLPTKAENNQWALEGIAITEAEWNPQTHAAWMNELWLHATWHPFHHSFFEVATIHAYGVRQNDVVDDLQGFSNINSENLALGLDVFGYGYETTFGTDSAHTFTLRTGIRNINEDYFITGNTTLFLNSSDGIFPSIGENFPLANFPLSGICLAHIDYKNNNGLGGQISVYNGIGGETLDGTAFRLRPKRDGITALAEITYNKESNYSFYNIGSTISNAPEHHNAPKHTKAAWWAIADQNIYKTEQSHLNLLLEGSRATFRDNTCSDFAGVGLIFGNDVQKRQTVKLTHIGAMNHYCKFAIGTEWSQELVANINILNRLSFLPSFQIIEKGNNVYTVAIARLTYTLE